MIFIWSMSHVIVTQQHAERVAAGRTKFFIVKQVKQPALIKIR